MTAILAIAVGAAAGLSALLGLAYLGRRRQSEDTPSHLPEDDAVILMRGDRVIDATEPARDILGCGICNEFGWADLREHLAARFPDLPESRPDRSLEIVARDDPDTRLRIEPAEDKLRLILSLPQIGTAERYALPEERHELALLRATCNGAPGPIWQTDADGRTLWRNAAFAELCATYDPDDPTQCPFDLVPPSGPQPRINRVSVGDKDGDGTRWFEVVSRRIGSNLLHFATGIDAVVEAEIAQRNFVQTLTKTFAHLPIGLAVFDRQRQLVLFNPALIDLTSLSAEFLSARPNLLSFFDHMRECRMMPEPKNYKTWRDQMSDLVAAARDDRYCETWNLASGLTYKITGRPHPDGAVAFLIEDISSEISLTRRFRSELELTQSVIDSFEDAVAVFSAQGILNFSNAAFRTMWKCDPDSAFADMTIADATRDWQAACEPSPAWGEMRDFVLDLGERAAWDTELRLLGGGRVICRVEPVAAGATLVRFAPIAETRARRKQSQAVDA